MRIISGSKRGHKLLAPRKNIARPMTDKNRETIFNILLHSKELSEFGFKLKDSIILDLFAGTGAFAFEAISRGAKKAILVENDQYKQGSELLVNTLIQELTNFKEKKVIVGGGDTGGFVNKYNHNFTHISTGGGASIEYISTNNLIGLQYF